MTSEPEATRSPIAPKKVTLGVKRAAVQHQRELLARYRHLLRDAGPKERLVIEQEGVPAAQVLRILETSGLTRVDFAHMTQLSQDVINAMLAGSHAFDGTSGQAVVGLIDVINAVEQATAGPGERVAPERLAAAWLRKPHPNLDGGRPAELMKNAEGRAVAMELLLDDGVSNTSQSLPDRVTCRLQQTT